MHSETAMTKQSDFEFFLGILLDATRRLGTHYFQLPVAGAEDPIFRERVYCYELYHLVREAMPHDCPYVLDGEVDKGGHPLLRKEIGPLKPDFIVHIPGTMDANLAVVEVKPLGASRENIVKDVETLKRFLDKADYFKAVHLVYGNGTEDDIRSFEEIHARGL